MPTSKLGGVKGWHMKLSEEQRKRLESKSRLKQGVWHKTKGGGAPRQLMGIVVGEVSIIVEDYKHVIHQIEHEKGFWDGSKLAYRTGYWTFAANMKKIV